MTDENATWAWIDQLCKVVEAVYRLGAESNRAELERAHEALDKAYKERDALRAAIANAKTEIAQSAQDMPAIRAEKILSQAYRAARGDQT